MKTFVVSNDATSPLVINRTNGAPVCIEFCLGIANSRGRLIVDSNGGLRYVNLVSGQQTQLAT